VCEYERRAVAWQKEGRKEGRGNNNVGCRCNSNFDLLGSTCPTLSQEYIFEMIIWDTHQRKTYVLFLLLYDLLLVI
jgi:hypothetical protein